MSQEGQRDYLRLVLAILLPPLGVFLQVGLGLNFWLNVCLTLFGWFPGIVHAAWVILTIDDGGSDGPGA